jgi:hypothetical protein
MDEHLLLKTVASLDTEYNYMTTKNSSIWNNPKTKYLGLFKTKEFLSPAGKPYIRRHILIENRWFAVYVNELLWPDEVAGDAHTHPWSFATLVLSGGYREKIHETDGREHERYHRRGSFMALNRHKAHWITKIEPRTKTLFLAGPLHDDWGFITPQGFVYWRGYLKKLGEAMPELERD